MGEKIKEKKFEILNYEELPKRGKYVSWKNIKNGTVLKTKHKDYGYNEFKYRGNDGSYLYLEYKKDVKIIKSDIFIYGGIGGILGKITKEFKIEIGTPFKDDKRDLIITDREYRSKEQKPNKKGRVYTKNEKWYKYKCLKCGYEGWIAERDLLHGQGCSCCYGRTAVLGINTIYDTDPWMMDLGVSEEDAKRYTRGSGKKIGVICPDCKHKKNIRVDCIYNNKSIQCNCGDGISYPEKFITSILNQLNIDFKTQYSPEYLIKDGSQKKSDFYISSLNLVIETDGGLGHKGGVIHSKSDKSLEELVKIDNWKDEQHLLHGVETIRINCFESDMDFIKNNILNSKLSKLFDLSQIDWNKCEEFALKNIVKEVCEYWNNKEDWETTTDLGGVFGANRNTISTYLKKGAKLGWCAYNPKEEMRKRNSKNGKSNGKQVEIFKDNILLGVFKSASELERQSENLFGVKLLQSGISAMCSGVKNKYKGYTFKYLTYDKEDEEYLKSQHIKEII